MSYNPPMYQPRHHRVRTFIVVVTLIIGAIFVFLLLSNKGSFFGTTAAVTDLQNNQDQSTPDGTTSNTLDGAQSVASNIADSASQLVSKSNPNKADSPIMPSPSGSKFTSAPKNEADTSLTFDSIPSIHKQVKLEEVTLVFEDLPQNLLVNNDQLQLGNIGEVTFVIKGFAGDMNLNDGFSLSGLAKSIDVNGISLSTQRDIKLSFANINYQKLDLANVELKGITFPRGKGQINVAGKLSYTLANDGLKVDYFRGSLKIDKTGDPVIDMQGITQGVGISGESLNLDVK